MRLNKNHDISKPLVLTSKQQKVLEVLKSEQTEKYPLSDWYHGALYALSNHYNPDRFAQAAHSLRELLQKLPRVVQRNEIHVSATDFAGMRRNINDRILKDKERYSESWKNKIIDSRFDKTLRKVEDYFSHNRQPTRREQIKQAVATIDPMVNSLGSEIQEVKRNQNHYLWNQLEEFSHHGNRQDVAEFKKYLEELENILFDLLAPVTAEDQKGIQTILSLPDKSDSDIEDMFSLIERRGANFVFFLRQVSESSDVTWLPYLKKRGYFAHPPTAQLSDDDSVIFPFWWPIHYLSKISNQAPDEVIELVEVLPSSNNPLVYDGILDIVLQLPIEYSVKLKDKILEYAGMEHQFRAYRYAKLLERWTKENQISAALELAKILVKFAPDPQSESKQKRRIENATDSNTLLKPSPHMLPGEYRDIIELNDLLEKLLNIAIFGGIEAAVSTFDKSFSKDVSVSFKSITLLKGITLETEIQIFDGIRLVPVPASSNLPRCLGSFSRTDVSDFYWGTMLVIDYSISPIFQKPSLAVVEAANKNYTTVMEKPPVEIEGFRIKAKGGKSPENTFGPSTAFHRKFCQALSLACNSGVKPARSWKFVAKDELLNINPTNSFWSGRPSGPFGDRIKVSEDQINEAKSLYDILVNSSSKTPTDLANKLQIPINRWIESKVSEDPVDKMIDLGTAFESLFLPSNVVDQLAFQFRLRASWHLGKCKADREKLMDEFKAIYTLRSKAVHNGELPPNIKIRKGVSVPTSEFIPKAQDLCRRSIMKILENREFPDWNSLVLGGKENE